MHKVPRIAKQMAIFQKPSFAVLRENKWPFFKNHRFAGEIPQFFLGFQQKHRKLGIYNAIRSTTRVIGPSAKKLQKKHQFNAKFIIFNIEF